MSLSIRTNYASLDAQRNLANTQNALDSSISRLSSGMRITKAGDDAAGLGISVNLEAQIASYNQAARNANDGSSLIQTAEGSMNEVSNILSRMRQLAMESASDGVGVTQRGFIAVESNQLLSELDRINNTAEFNGNNFLLATGTQQLTFQVGIRATVDDAITVDTSTMAVDSASLTVDGVDLGTDAATSQQALAFIDAAIDSVSSYRATLGAAGNRFQSVVTNIQTASENLSSADSRIRDVDVAEETSKLSRSQILAQAGISVLAQANQMPQLALKLLG
jgi:flagellin